MALAPIESCLDVTPEHIAAALAPARSLAETSPRERSLDLLRAMARVARPGAGAPRMLVVISAMAKRDWVDGSLLVKLIGDSEVTVIDLFVEAGLDAEKMAGPIRVDVPLDEFRRVVTDGLATIAPLRPVEAPGPRRIVLRGVRDQRQFRRKASISALSTDFLQMAARGPTKTSSSSPAPAKETGTSQEMASFDKPAAILEMPEGLDAPRGRRPSRPAPARKPPPPRKR